MLSPLNFFRQRSTDCVYMSLFLGFLFCSIGLYINVSLFFWGGVIYLFIYGCVGSSFLCEGFL